MSNAKEFFTFTEATELTNKSVDMFTKNDLMLLAAQKRFPLYFYHYGFLGVMSENDYSQGMRQTSRRFPFDGIVKLASFHYGHASTRGTNFVFQVSPIKWFRHQAKIEKLEQEIKLTGSEHVVMRVSMENELILDEVPIEELLISAEDVKLLVQQQSSPIEKPVLIRLLPFSDNGMISVHANGHTSTRRPSLPSLSARVPAAFS